MPAVLAPSPVTPALEDAAASLGAVGARLLAVLLADYPHGLRARPAQVLKAAGARAGDLDALLRGAGLADLDELRDRAAAETGTRLSAPNLRFTRRDEHGGGGGESRPFLGRLLAREQENLAHTADNLQRSGAFELAAAAVLAGRRRYVVGDQKSAGYAALFASDLSAALPHVTLVAPSSKAVVDELADVRSTDVLIAYCFRRYSRLTLAVAREVRSVGGCVVGITDHPDGPMAQVSDHVLVVDTRSEAHTDSPTTVVAVGHSLAALASAGAKGAGRRRERRTALAHALDVYAADGAA